MNTKQKLLGIAVCGAALVFSAFAEEAKQGESAARPTTPVQTARNPSVNAEQKINQYINGNLFGIQNVKKDANKRIVSIVSIGRAPLSSSLTKASAKNQAFKKADANARAEFMKWLTTQVTYTRIDQDDVAIVQRGESLGDTGQGKASVTSEATELSQEQVVSVASGFAKGMVQIGAGMSEDGEAVVILGWSAETADRMDEVRDQNIPREPKQTMGSIAADGDKAGATAAPNKDTSVSDAANDYL